MNHDQKAASVLAEILFENWMTMAEWKDFLKKAKKTTGYCAEFLADDIASKFKSNEYVDSRIAQMAAFKKSHFAL